MKCILIKAILVFLPLCLLQEADDVQEATDALLGTVDLSEWDAWFSEEAPDISFKPSDFVYGIADDADSNGGKQLSERIGGMLLSPAKTASTKLILLIGIGILSAALQSIQTSGSVSEAARIAFRIGAACNVLVMIVPAIRETYRMLSVISGASDRVLPILIAYLTLCGTEHTAAALPQLSELFNGMMIRVIESTVLPIGCIGGMLLTFDAYANGRLTSVGRLLLRTAKLILAGLGTAYGTFGVFRGITASSADGLMFRTAKLAAGSLPAVGGIVSDSVETAYQCMVFVRRTLGVGCAAMLLLVCIGPILRAFFLRCSFRAAAAVSEPLSGRPYADLLHGLSELLQILMLCELTAAASAILMITPVIGIFGHS